jgi:[amino group carrier protein]-lysine/ornithine hydrolase
MIAARTPITTIVAEQLLVDLVSIPSPSHSEQHAAAFLVDWMNAHGYDEAFIDEAGNAVGIIGSGPRDVVLLGHIDTFGGDLPVYTKGRTLYGRGAVDAKGALCTFAAAAAQANLSDDLRVIVIGAVEEEASSSKGARYAAGQYQPELCIIGEPSQWDRITLGYKGRLLLRCRWEGPLAHSASQTSTGPEHIVDFWLGVQARIAQINAGRERVFDRVDVTLQEMNSGQEGAYGRATGLIGFRLPPDIDPYRLAEQLSVTNNEPGLTITAYGHERAYVGDKDSALSRTLRQSIRAQGGTPRFVHKTGTADMNVVAPFWNCPMVAYGPGDSAYDHTPDERLDLDDYARAVAVLTDILSHL